VNHGDGDFDVGINFTVRADDQRTARRTDAARQVAVNPHHCLEVSFTSYYRAAADKAAERAFFDIAGQTLALGHSA
jgi:hypothetical protein